MHILVVEDNRKLAASLKKGLEGEGYAVDCLFDGESAQTRIEGCHRDYDAVILDVMLPSKDGFEICRTVRQKGIAIPILCLTAKDSVSDRLAGLDGGADDYLIKPFSFEELVARIRALLRRPKEMLPPVLRIRDIVLNPVTRKVFRRDKEILLTLKEFHLLEFFMRNPDRVLDRETILDHLWDFACDSFSNVIDVHMRNLRKKLCLSKNDKFLESVRGVGYRLNQ